MLTNAGIAITDEDIRLARPRKGTLSGELKLARLLKEPIPLGAIESGIIKDPSLVVPILKTFSQYLNSSFVRATLPEEKAYLFTTSIEMVPLKGLRDAVAFIIEENVPISLEESVFDFEIIGGSSDASNPLFAKDSGETRIRLAVTVLPKTIVNSYIQLFESAGMSPVGFDTESQAIARALIKKGDRGLYLIINFSLRKSGFYIVEDEVVQFSTTLGYGVGENDTLLSINNLKEEMRKVLSFWNVHGGSPLGSKMPIKRAVICGTGATRTDFVQKLMEESDVEYTIANVQTRPFDSSPDYAAVIGLVTPNDK